MNLSELTDSEILYLIENLKAPVDEFEFMRVYNNIVQSLIPGSEKMTSFLVDITEEIEYVLHTWDSGISGTFSISLRFKDDPHTLLRFDFGDHLRHTNRWNQSDEHVVVGPHMHVYAIAEKKVPKDVIPLNDVRGFPRVRVIRDAYLAFLEYANVRSGGSENGNQR
jgi:hypothetical protein